MSCQVPLDNCPGKGDCSQARDSHTRPQEVAPLTLLPPSNLSPWAFQAPATSLVQNNSEEASKRPRVQDGVGLRAGHPGLIRSPCVGPRVSQDDRVVC